MSGRNASFCKAEIVRDEHGVIYKAVKCSREEAEFARGANGEPFRAASDFDPHWYEVYTDQAWPEPKIGRRLSSEDLPADFDQKMEETWKRIISEHNSTIGAVLL